MKIFNEKVVCWSSIQMDILRFTLSLHVSNCSNISQYIIHIRIDLQIF